MVLDLDHPEPRLGDGFRVFLRIAAWTGDHVLQVPLGALFRTDDSWTVFLIRDGRAQLTRITVGHMNGVSAEVTNGLSAGDRLVLYPGDRLSNGIEVTQRRPSTPD